MRPSPNVGGDALKTPDIPRQVGDVAQHVQSQLTSSIDVKAAHQWVQPSGGEMHLPKFSFGTEGASLQAVMPGGEQHALAAAHQVGNQAISPIIQMIMKMPGHIGLISSFFEALQSFFAPIQDMIGGLDASLFTANAEAAASVASGSGAEHFGLDLSLLPEDAPVFNMDDGGGLSEVVPTDASAAMGNTDLNSFNSSEPLSDTSSALNTSGYSDAGAHYEQVPAGLERASQGVQDGIVTPQYLAMDNGQAIFRPTMGGFNAIPNSAQIQVPPNVPPSQPTIIHPLTHQIAPHHPVVSARDVAPAPEHTLPQHAAEPAADRGTLLGHPHTRIEHSVDQVTAEQQAPADAQQAQTEQVSEQAHGAEQASEQTTSYTVKPGDNLWDIAQHHLGDGLKWQEIYQLNHEIIGGDPTMIHPGTELQLPGGNEIASNYTVQPGDNLWDISKAHLGGGQHWGDLFHQNSDVIGSNPSLIHPGQHLSMGGDHAGQLASADPSHAAAHHATSHVTQHAQQVAQAPTHAQPAHHVASSHHGAADHAKVASATPHTAHPAAAQTEQVAAGSQQVPEALAATPSGQMAGLHASAPMGSLETSAHSVPAALPDKP